MPACVHPCTVAVVSDGSWILMTPAFLLGSPPPICSLINMQYDLTPPEYITMLITEVGPSAGPGRGPQEMMSGGSTPTLCLAVPPKTSCCIHLWDHAYPFGFHNRPFVPHPRGAICLPGTASDDPADLCARDHPRVPPESERFLAGPSWQALACLYHTPTWPSPSPWLLTAQ